MSKRFTATEKWADPWFQDLAPVLKCAWIYILDNCDQAGVWVVNEKLISFQVGKGCSWADVKRAFGERLIEFAPGKVWVPKFIAFQYGTLSEAAKPHQRVIALLKAYGLYEAYLSKGYPKGIDTLEEEDRDQEKEEEKEKKKEEGEPGGETKPPPFSHPWLSETDFIPAWRGWLEMRVQKRNKPTDLAKQMAMTELQTLCNGDRALAIRIINQSTLKGWLSFFPLKGNDHGNGTGTGRKDHGKNSREFPEHLAL